ncbi:SNF1-related protein kinase regulatory subunit gamma-1-like [Phoenix dactylifera]|uniref:SNF1-related protein kinase regulatory subunit gamma-1-like n=1 Tax=Phoenix dactylifera TaxID=42345 RepID=A0A8B9AL10_PHODC|nr:SNF1-related protein kinase regulatory subunit gamma-1-like [Phoenix dactylifera]XP_038986372.1 SNF1-related protein kinase regulatory subunit gamma-1-like [Phoenix dactylifera]
MGKDSYKNLLQEEPFKSTMSAIVQGLKHFKGSNCFDCIAAGPISDFGLPFMSYKEARFQILCFLLSHIKRHLTVMDCIKTKVQLIWTQREH